MSSRGGIPIHLGSRNILSPGWGRHGRGSRKGLRFDGPGGTVISGLRVRNLRQGVGYAAGTGHVLRHAQFVDVGEAVRLRDGTSLTVGRIAERRTRDPACDRFIRRFQDQILKLRM